MKVGEKQLNAYLNGPDYAADLAVVQKVWSRGGAFRRSGFYIYMNLLSNPALMEVEMLNSQRMETPDGVYNDLLHTRRFLKDLVGLSESLPEGGGLHQKPVQQMLLAMGHRHHAFEGMANWMMDYLAYIIASGPEKTTDFASANVKAYYRYMTEAWRLMGCKADLSQAKVRADFDQLSAEHAKAGVHTANYLENLYAVYKERFGTEVALGLYHAVRSSLVPSVQQVVKDCSRFLKKSPSIHE